MIIPSFEEIQEITNSRYELVMLVSKRARKLVDNNPKLVETKSNKPVTIAIEEIMARKVKFGEKMSDAEYDERIKKQRAELIDKLKREYFLNPETQEEIEEE
ncbi:DNA-directed RNA polymerase subunit omega [Peptoniphilus sp.]|jgi:DNA-directed RNA polymerase subunit omega|uniref:DNA-directed RNA polymerase subunit omega n=1 Tax=Peptoniphilus sp. TaxID=1971214 RepID=UPI003D911057